MDKFIAKRGWGPQARRAALSLTFDNLGEAAALEMGMWNDKPVGEHFTAAFVPELIEVLGDVRATYFIEASNAAIYPEAIKRWHAAGHEVGLHAWRHEAWNRAAPERRRDILQRSLKAMRSIGIAPVGFRPPGGALPAEAWEEFEEAGLLYCSDVSERGLSRIGGMLSLPFRWRHVDSYMIEDLMKPLRQVFGDPASPYSLAQWTAELENTIAEAVEEGGHRVIIFHPEFIGAAREKLEIVEWLIERAQRADLWIARARDVAEFVQREDGIAERQA